MASQHYFDGYSEGLLVEGIFLKLAEKTLHLEILANKGEMFDSSPIN